MKYTDIADSPQEFLRKLECGEVKIVHEYSHINVRAEINKLSWYRKLRLGIKPWKKY